MESVVVGIAFAALFALWFVKKPEWSRHHDGLDPLPRAALSPAPTVPPRALEAADAGTLFRPDIEGLRSIAVLLVLVYHARFGLVSGGFIGVDVFFVLSGFLITSLLLRELAATGTVSLANFWARRARRLLPASGLVLLVTLLSSRWLIDGLSQGELARDAIAGCLFVANIRFWSVGTDYLTEGLRESPLLHFWSLAVEEQFYLVWPGLLLLLVRVAKVSRRTLAIIIGAGFVTSLAACIWLTNFADYPKPQWAFFMLPARAWELLAGAALALASGHLFRVGRQLTAILGWVGVGAVLAVAIEFDVDTPFPGVWAIVPVLATVFVINAGHVPEGPIRILRAKPLQWIGARSYAIYLWHFPMLVMVGRKWGDRGLIETLPVATRVGVLAASVVLAAVSYHLVENPVRHSRQLSFSPARSLAMGAWVALIGVGGAALLLNNPPELSAGGVAAEVTLATGTTLPPSTTVATTSPVSVPGATTTLATTTTTAPARAADASMDNPPELASLLAANLPVLSEAVSISKVPSNLSPSLNRASKDLPQVYDNGCILDVGDNEPKQCIYGDPNGSVTIVLFGDSHAAEWMPALHKVSSTNGWRLIVHTKKACPDAEIPTDKDPNETDCAVWRKRVIELIGGMQPDLVIMSSYRYKQVGAAAGRDPDQVWKEGIELTVSKVRPLTGRLLLLGDSATPKEDIPTCLAGNLSNVGNCMDSRSGAVRPGRLAVEREVALAYDADFIPTSDWMCTASACPVIIGNVLMYRDNSHITATASEFLSPYVEAAVKAVLA
ncbi:MAG: acyltransferase family protein [Ilumatobacteraceae bacterium]